MNLTRKNKTTTSWSKNALYYTASESLSNTDIQIKRRRTTVRFALTIYFKIFVNFMENVNTL